MHTWEDGTDICRKTVETEIEGKIAAIHKLSDENFLPDLLKGKVERRLLRWSDWCMIKGAVKTPYFFILFLCLYLQATFSGIIDKRAAKSHKTQRYSTLSKEKTPVYRIRALLDIVHDKPNKN